MRLKIHNPGSKKDLPEHETTSDVKTEMYEMFSHQMNMFFPLSVERDAEILNPGEDIDRMVQEHHHHSPKHVNKVEEIGELLLQQN